MHNTYYLYPRLPQYISQQIADTQFIFSVGELVDTWMTTHQAVTFAPTGGNRISAEQLNFLRSEVLSVAQRYGYPEPPDQNNARSFDIDCAVVLFETMKLHPSEASHNEIWSFLGCVLLVDIVRWRFNDSIDTARYIGRERGMRRHTFGRLWWRAYLLYAPQQQEPYGLLKQLNEDDFVQVTERSSIAARPALFRAFCTSFTTAIKTYEGVSRRPLIREASQRLYRLLALTAVEALNDQELSMLTDAIFAETASILSTHS